MARQYAVGGPLGVGYVIDAEDWDFALQQSYIVGTGTRVGQPTLAVSPNPGATGGTVTSASFTTPAGYLLICMAVARSGSTMPTLTDSLGETWTALTAGNVAGGGSMRSRMFAKVASGAAQTITITATGAGQTAAVLMQIASAEVVSSNIQMDTGASGSRSLTMNAFGSGAGCLYFLCGGAGTTWSTPTGYTELVDGSPATNTRLVAGYDRFTPATAISTNPTAGTIDSTLYGIEIKVPAAGGGVSVNVTGQEVTTSVDTVQVATNVFPTGESIAVSCGDVTVVGNASVDVTGQSVTASVGTVTVTVGGATVPWTPSEITSGMVGWFDAADSGTLTFSGSNLTVWADKSPAANNATPHSTGPTLTSVNSLGSLNFAAQGLKTTTAISLGDFAAFVVFTPDASGSYERLLDQDFTNGFWFGRDGTTATWGGGIRLATPPYGYFVSLANSSCHQVMMRRLGTTQYHSGNGGAVTNSNSCTGTATSSNVIGIASAFNDTTPSDRLNNDVISEILIWSYSLTSGDQSRVEGYLAWKWGIQASLPSGHPYKSAPPVVAAPGTSVNVTGESVTTSVGTVSIVGKASVDVTGQSAAVSVGTVSASGKASVDVSGQSITVSRGDVTATGKASVNATTNLVTASLGNETVVGKANVNVTTAPGSLDDELYILLGNETVVGKANVNVTTNVVTVDVASVSVVAGGGVSVGLSGNEVTASVGTVTTTDVEVVNATGQSVAASSGTVSVETGTSVNVTGQSVTVSDGTVSVRTGAGVSVTGQNVTVSRGDVTISAPATTASVTGQQVAVSRGTVTVAVGIGQSVSVTGQQIAASVGTVSANGKAAVDLAGQGLTVELGSVSVATATLFPVTGLGMTVSVGNASVSVAMHFDVSGVVATVLTGQVGTEFDYTFEVSSTEMTVHLGRAFSPNWGWGTEGIREDWTSPDIGDADSWIPVPGSQHAWQKPSSDEDEDWSKQTRQPNEWH